MQKINKLAISLLASTSLLTNMMAKDITSLDIITVSAQKSEENIQDVPINITMFNEFDIEDRDIGKIEDLGAYK